MRVPDFVYSLYERTVLGGLEPESVPRHIGIILDGNRRWAKSIGTPVAHGHRRGADKISEVLSWAEEAGIEIVTLWMLSTDNLSRSSGEIADLIDIILRAVEQLSASRRWRLRLVGSADVLPADAAQRLMTAIDATADVDGMNVNVAIGYGGRQEITEAVRSYLSEAVRTGKSLEEVVDSFSLSDITDHLYTKGQPDPDLIIRTSGEQRMSGFMLWQTVHTELYFCEAYWPDFRRTDFLRALRDFAQRERRLGK